MTTVHHSEESNVNNQVRIIRVVWSIFLAALMLLLALAGHWTVSGAPDAGNAPQGQYLIATPVDVIANDLVYDAVEDVVYASVPSSGGANGNSIVPISPSGFVGEGIFVGSEPNVMALSANGRYLYVGIDGAGAFRRVDLAAQTIEPLWPLGAGFCGLFTAEDMVVPANDEDAVVIARRNSGCSPGHEGVAVYDDGVMRPETTQGHTGSNAIEPSGDPGVFYGYTRDSTDFGFRVLATSEDGITETMAVAGLIAGFGTDIHYASGRVYATDGHVVDPSSLTLAGTFAAQGPLAVDVAAGVIYFAAGDPLSGPLTLRAFDLDTFLPLFSAEFPLFDGAYPVELLVVEGVFFARLTDDRVFRLELIEASAISGRVIDQYGYPVSGVTIADDAGHTTTTDFDGRYTLAPLPDGEYKLTASHDSYTFAPPSIQVTVPPNATGQDFAAAPAPTSWGICMPVVQR
jgi:hypothetical protein